MGISSKISFQSVNLGVRSVIGSRIPSATKNKNRGSETKSQSFYIQNAQASIDPRTPKRAVQMPLREILGAALPVNVAGGGVAEDVLLDDTSLAGSTEPPPYVIVVGPSSVIVDVRVLVP